MRDRTKSRSYSPEAERFREEHARARDRGLRQRHGLKLWRLRRERAEAAALTTPEPARATSQPPAPPEQPARPTSQPPMPAKLRQPARAVGQSPVPDQLTRAERVIAPTEQPSSPTSAHAADLPAELPPNPAQLSHPARLGGDKGRQAPRQAPPPTHAAKAPARHQSAGPRNRAARQPKQCSGDNSLPGSSFALRHILGGFSRRAPPFPEPTTNRHRVRPAQRLRN